RRVSASGPVRPRCPCRERGARAAGARSAERSGAKRPPRRFPRGPFDRGVRVEGAARAPRGLGAQSAPERSAPRGVRAAPSTPPSVATRVPFMRILIVGNGWREHALLWKLRRDAPGAEFFSTRPNGGMTALSHGVDLAPEDGDGIVRWASA